MFVIRLSPMVSASLAWSFAILATLTVHAQQAVELAAPPVVTQQSTQYFSSASDGPIGPGWSRPDEVARTYFHEELPALFKRTLALAGDVPVRGELSWRFTG